MLQLHILNGDAIQPHFDIAGIEGDRMICREMLVEGKTVKDLFSTDFIKHRVDFFKGFLNGANALYQERFLPELNKLRKPNRYEEITLWFEYDLFCQINMVAILSALLQQGAKNISLICAGKWKGNEDLIGLGEIEPKQFPELFKRRKKLKPSDLLFADKFWSTYCGNQPNELLKLAQNAPPAFPYLTEVLIKAHLKRFPYPENGLNEIENTMLRLIMEGQHNRKSLMGTMLQWQHLYGFGDWQYEMYLNHLSPLLRESPDLQLNELGMSIYRKTANFLQHSNHNYQWGGCQHRDFFYDENAGRLNKK